jgi:ribosomal protein S18 acetylase RimI-like enzyme
MTLVRPARWTDHAQLVPVIDDFALLHHRMDPVFRTRWLGFTEAIFQTWLDEPGDYHRVAEIDGRVVGYLWAGRGEGNTGIYLFMRRSLFVYVLAVAEAERGRGVGRALLGAIEDEARACDAEIVQLSVVGANARAKALYRSLGYEVSSELMTKTLKHVRRIEG